MQSKALSNVKNALIFFFVVIFNGCNGKKRKKLRHFKKQKMAIGMTIPFINCQSVPFIEIPPNSGGKNMLGEVPSNYIKRIKAHLYGKFF
jgi:hypothetical protein